MSRIHGRRGNRGDIAEEVFNLVVGNNTAAARAKNRRVEVIVT
jgi:hypothetical protein